MEILIGQDKWDKSANPKKIILNTKTLVNNHMMIVGGSGSGKTYNLRKIIRDLVKDKKNTIHILDVHGDIDIGEDVTDTIKFSESSTNVVVCAPSNFYLPDDLLIASMKGLNLSVLLGSAIDFAKPKRHRAWEINIEELCEFI